MELTFDDGKRDSYLSQETYCTDENAPASSWCLFINSKKIKKNNENQEKFCGDQQAQNFQNNPEMNLLNTTSTTKTHEASSNDSASIVSSELTLVELWELNPTVTKCRTRFHVVCCNLTPRFIKLLIASQRTLCVLLAGKNCMKKFRRRFTKNASFEICFFVVEKDKLCKGENVIYLTEDTEVERLDYTIPFEFEPKLITEVKTGERALLRVIMKNYYNNSYPSCAKSSCSDVKIQPGKKCNCGSSDLKEVQLVSAKFSDVSGSMTVSMFEDVLSDLITLDNDVDEQFEELMMESFNVFVQTGWVLKKTTQKSPPKSPPTKTKEIGFTVLYCELIKDPADDINDDDYVNSD